MVPSASSTAIHSAAVNNSSATLYLNENNHGFYEKTSSGTTVELSGAYTVKAFSAGVDSKGNAFVTPVVSKGENAEPPKALMGWPVCWKEWFDVFAALKGRCHRS